MGLQIYTLPWCTVFFQLYSLGVLGLLFTYLFPIHVHNGYIWVMLSWSCQCTCTKYNVTKVQAFLSCFLWVVPKISQNSRRVLNILCCCFAPSLPLLVSIFEYCNTSNLFSSSFWVLLLQKTLADILRKNIFNCIWSFW